MSIRTAALATPFVVKSPASSVMVAVITSSVKSRGPTISGSVLSSTMSLIVVGVTSVEVLRRS
jgi:hypothetical protein